MPETLRKLSKNAFKRKIKQTLFEILASEDCYIDLPKIVQKVQLDLFSFSQYVIINIVYCISSLLSSLCRHLLLVIPLVYQQSLVIVVNFSFFSSLVTFSCIQLYLVVFISCKRDPPRLAQLPRGHVIIVLLPQNTIKKCIYVCAVCFVSLMGTFTSY